MLRTLLYLPIASRCQPGVTTPSRGTPAVFRASTARAPMLDGNEPAADVYVPKAGGKLSVVLIQTPLRSQLLRRHWTWGGPIPQPLTFQPGPIYGEGPGVKAANRV